MTFRRQQRLLEVGTVDPCRLSSISECFLIPDQRSSLDRWKPDDEEFSSVPYDV